MRTPQQIVDEASNKFNRASNGMGLLSRQDVLDFLSQLDPEADKIEALKTWIDTISFLTPLDKSRLLDDLPSYGI